MKRKYSQRTAVPKVTLTVTIDLPRYNALQRYRIKTGDGQVHTVTKALSLLPGFDALLREEQEAYAKKANSTNTHTIEDITKVQQDIATI